MIEIKYCSVWNYLPEALRVRDQLSTLGHPDIRLVKGEGGIFEILANNKLIYSKTSTGRFPSTEEINGLNILFNK